MNARPFLTLFSRLLLGTWPGEFRGFFTWSVTSWQPLHTNAHLLPPRSGYTFPIAGASEGHLGRSLHPFSFCAMARAARACFIARSVSVSWPVVSRLIVFVIRCISGP